MHTVVLTVWESAQILHFITLTSKAVLIGKDHISNKARQIKISIYLLVTLSFLRVRRIVFSPPCRELSQGTEKAWKVKASKLRIRWRQILEKVCINCTHEIQTIQTYLYTKYAVVHSKELMACNNGKLFEQLLHINLHIFAHAIIHLHQHILHVTCTR